MKFSEEMNSGTIQVLKWRGSDKGKRQGKVYIKVEQGRTTMGKHKKNC